MQPLQLAHSGCAGPAFAAGATTSLRTGQRSQCSHSHTQGSAADAASAPDCVRRPRSCEPRRGSSASGRPAWLWVRHNMWARELALAPLPPRFELSRVPSDSRLERSPSAGRIAAHLLRAALRKSGTLLRCGASSPVITAAYAMQANASSTVAARVWQRRPLIAGRHAQAKITTATRDP